MDTSHNIVLKFSRRYSMGHRLISGAAKNCQIPHGHDEVVTVNIASKNNEGLDPNTNMLVEFEDAKGCLLYTSPSPRDRSLSRMPSSA